MPRFPETAFEGHIKTFTPSVKFNDQAVAEVCVKLVIEITTCDAELAGKLLALQKEGDVTFTVTARQGALALAQRG